jgi:phage-related minor tail protein
MSVFSQTLEAIRDAMRLTDDVHRVSQALQSLTDEMRDHDRRITRLEAQWETAIMLAQRRLE